MRAVLHAVCLGMLAPALMLLTAAPSEATEPRVDATTSGAARSCWLPEEDLASDHCGDSYLYAGADESRQRRRALVEFGLGPGSLPAGATVLSAEVHLFQEADQTSGAAGQADYTLIRPGADWTEWSGPGEEVSLAPVTLDASDGWRTWALRPDAVQDWAEGGSARVALRQVGRENRRQTVGFRSAAAPRTRPYLEITYELPIYVSPDGDDTNKGTAKKPVRTIQRAVDMAVSGQGIQLANGTYDRFSVPSGKTNLTIDGEDEAGVLIDNPTFAVGNLVTIYGAGTTLSDLTVQQCRPDPAQDDTLETDGSAGIRIAGGYRVTISNVTVRGGREMIDDTRGRGCYGIMSHQAWGLELVGNDIYDNGAGIYVYGGGSGRIHDNSVHDHSLALIRNSSGGGDDFGAAGITFDHVLAGQGGYLAEWNTITNNAARSFDYGYDGGGFEIYASSDIEMSNNTLVANDTALETGADTDSDPDVGCQNNRFTDNKVVGYDGDHGQAPHEPGRLARKGLVLRCDQDMLVADNWITDAEYGAITLVVSGGVFDANLDGLRITGNTVIQHGADHFISVEADLRAFDGLELSDNTYLAGRCDWYFAKFWFVSQAFEDWTRALESAGVAPAETGSTFSCL